MRCTMLRPTREAYADPYAVRMDLGFSGEMVFWKGPAPWHFVAVPDDECGAIASVAAQVSYGWGVIPATARIGTTEWTTALFPKDGRYLVPIRSQVRAAEGLDIGDVVTVRLTIDV